jgi:hypothetical protein
MANTLSAHRLLCRPVRVLRCGSRTTLAFSVSARGGQAAEVTVNNPQQPVVEHLPRCALDGASVTTSVTSMTRPQPSPMPSECATTLIATI